MSMFVAQAVYQVEYIQIGLIIALYSKTLSSLSLEFYLKASLIFLSDIMLYLKYLLIYYIMARLENDK